MMTASIAMTTDTRLRDRVSDSSLAEAAARGDEVARREVVTRLVRPVRGTLSYLLGGDSDAEDLTQNALIKILSSIGCYKGESSLETWAKRIAARVAYRHFEKHGRRAGLREQNWVPECIERGVDEKVEIRSVRARISGHLQRLSKDMRTALVLHLVEGYTTAEVAELTEVPLGTARDRLYRGRSKLKKMTLADQVLRDWFETRKI